MKVGGIPPREDLNRVVDVLGFRHTFCTKLRRAGVPLRIAQAAMRHSDPKLTANIYTDPELLDVAGAVNALSSLSLDAEPVRIPQEQGLQAEGTTNTAFSCEAGDSSLAPRLAPIRCKPSHLGSISGKKAVRVLKGEQAAGVAVTPCDCAHLAEAGNMGQEKRVERETGIEPATFSLGS